MGEALEYIVDYNDCVNKKILPYVLAIELLETGEMIGDVGLSEYVIDNNEMEIGISICEKYQKLGYATEAVETTDVAKTVEIAETGVGFAELGNGFAPDAAGNLRGGGEVALVGGVDVGAGGDANEVFRFQFSVFSVDCSRLQSI